MAWRWQPFSMKHRVDDNRRNVVQVPRTLGAYRGLGDVVNVGAIRDRLVAYQGSEDAALLDEAIDGVDELEHTDGFAELAEAIQALVWTLGAGALTLRARTAHQRPDDLDRSITWGENAARAWPEGDPNRARTQSNLATALTDRYERDGEHRDLVRALEFFRSARTSMEAVGDRLDVVLHGYGCCLHTLAVEWDKEADERIKHLNQAIGLFDLALQQPEPSADERAGYLNSLGLSLRAKAVMLSDPRQLNKACEAYREAQRLAGSGSESYIASSANLVVALQDHAEIENEVASLHEAIAICRKVLPMLDASDDEQRRRILTNVAAALIDAYRSSRDKSFLDEAARDLRDAAEQSADGPARWTVLANLGAALHETFDYTGELVVLEQAISVQETLVASAESVTPERLLNLGVSLLARFRRRRGQKDLKRAIALFDDAARSTDLSTVRASAMNSEANARSLRFDEYRGTLSLRPEIDRCIALREAAIRAAPMGSLDQATYKGNLGVDLLKRYELTAEGDDLERAIALQRRAVRTAPAASTDQPRLIAGLADSLAARADQTHAAGDRRAARAAYRRALAAGRESLPEQALAAAMRWGNWEARHRRWDKSVEAYAFGLEMVRQLVAGQQARPDKESWLADASGLPSAAGYVSAKAHDLERAVVMIEDGRAILLAEALARAHRLGSAHDLRATSDSPDFGAGLTERTGRDGDA
jgi:hypothetical protein